MNSHNTHWLSATEAARALGVIPATLYAYVSRGLIRSEPAGGRSRRYHAGDIADLTRGGAPNGSVVETAITLTRGGRVFFRGCDAVDLARTLSVREAAALIWNCDPAGSFAADNVPDPLPGGGALLDALATASPLARMVALLHLAAANEPYWPPAGTAFFGYAGARLLRFLAAAVAGVAPSARPIEAVLAEAWGLGRETRPLLRAGLILSADNGVDSAALATRAVAGSLPPRRAVAVGLAALASDADDVADARAGALMAMLPRASGTPRTLPEAIAKLGETLGIPPGGAASLYAIGRAIGLVAHVAEARGALRPFRARGAYVGIAPEAAAIPQSGKG
jgi:citrate synthase